MRKGPSFWLIILTLTLSIFLSALEVTVVSNALPVIVYSLQGSNFAWVGMAYALASSASMPMSGGLAEICGRRYTMLGALLLFMTGSALCGSARNMNWLIGGRVVQGLGGGGVVSLSTIIMADLVPLSERALYNLFIVLAWATASTIGPLVGGAFSNAGQWRWIFYMNIPICGLCILMVLTTLSLPTPPGTLREKFSKIDWIGNCLIIASTTSITLGLSWGGAKFSWSSYQVLLSLILGFCGLISFVVYEAKFAPVPILPITIISNRSSLSGYIQTFTVGIGLMGIPYYLPVYYQACQRSSALHSGVLMLGMTTTLCIFMISVGLSVAKAKKYRPQMWVGWCIYITGFAVLSTLTPSSSVARAVGFPVITSAGLGILVATGYFPILAPLPVTQNAYALAFYTFLRTFANIWGISIGAAVLQNKLNDSLTPDILSQMGLREGDPDLLYSIISQIRFMEPTLQEELSDAFSKSLRIVWLVFAGISCIGLAASTLMPNLPLQNQLDEKWQIDRGGISSQSEKSSTDGSSVTFSEV
ncbi:hypothetical protein GYMLUDRAFT_176382 [Collybiopsis luxurians FD-317 M1]|uniref:Major facilitator superfamily (MFS) profile domain-containing protein n=1 Tax=Collybiopsis luxurians FD-317 M1 TaxID=944289 RepID=A0A0D0CIR8_9AGAR|nr:hypothetical protein GYMLUDRAFT_176382 [Collybiopsis luxurians FD-317 M1]